MFSLVNFVLSKEHLAYNEMFSLANVVLSKKRLVIKPFVLNIALLKNDFGEGI